MNEELVKRLRTKFEDFAKDGWTAAEVLKFIWEALSELIPGIEKVYKAEGPKKKAAVLAMLSELYYSVDPDLPLVFGPLERYIEGWLLNTVASFLVDKLVEIYNKMGWPA